MPHNLQRLLFAARDDARVTRVVSGDTIEVVIQGIGFTIGYYGMQGAENSNGSDQSRVLRRTIACLQPSPG